MLRVVFDVNVWIHAITGPASTYPYLDSVPPRTANPSADCLSLALDGEKFQVFSSPHILRNVARVLEELGYQDAFISRYLEGISDATHFSGGSIVEPARTVAKSTDFEDNLILDLVVAVKAELLVTLDGSLRQLSPVKGAVIIDPDSFVRWVLR
ncbi:hypothetical protein AKACHI_11320 [Aquiluna sp. KACHI24]|nr:hypothetical protein AKACHI_11320 [Aquiluna sp. KACHI24]